MAFTGKISSNIQIYLIPLVQTTFMAAPTQTCNSLKAPTYPNLRVSLQSYFTLVGYLLLYPFTLNILISRTSFLSRAFTIALKFHICTISYSLMLQTKYSAKENSFQVTLSGFNLSPIQATDRLFFFISLSLSLSISDSLIDDVIIAPNETRSLY